MTTRHQRGYIFEAHGAFHVRYNVRVDGVIRQRSHRLCTIDRNTGHGTKSAKAVRQLCEDFMRGVNEQSLTIAAPQSRTVVSFFNWTYYRHIKRNLKPSTVYCYRHIWQQHLKNHFGDATLNEYRTGKATQFLTTLAKKYGPRMLAHIKALASGIFAHAVAIDAAEQNPWRDAKVLGKTLPIEETEAYTLEEMQAILNTLTNEVDLQLIMALAFFCGLRKGEIQGLRWEDVKSDHLVVSLNVVGGVVGTLKGKKKTRRLPLIKPVALLFRLWKAKAPVSAWVFSNGAGNPIALKDVASKRIRPALLKAGLTWKGYHAGRRGLGTALRTLTGNSNAGRDMLGHTDEKITQEHYEADMPEEVLKGMKLLEGKVTIQ